jgi:hypothetical protein
LVADHGDYGVFFAAHNRPWDRGRQGGAMVEAVATKDALLAAWIGIAA